MKERDAVTDIAFYGTSNQLVKSIIPGLQHTVRPAEARKVDENCNILDSIGRSYLYVQKWLKLTLLDHIAFAVEHEKAEEICAWYTAQFGFIRSGLGIEITKNFF